MFFFIFDVAGAIPPGIGKLEALNHLYVNNNRLEGKGRGVTSA